MEKKEEVAPELLRDWYNLLIADFEPLDHQKKKKCLLGYVLDNTSVKKEKIISTDDLKLKLIESETQWLLTIASSFLDAESGKMQAIEKKTVAIKTTAETQTRKCSIKIKGCETIDVNVRAAFVNASAWDLYDTYADVGAEGLGIKEFQMLIDTALKSKGVLQTEMVVTSEFTRMPADKQMKRIAGTKSFLHTALTVERLLASKTFENKQTLLKNRVRGKYDTVLPSNFKYLISLLWTYGNHFPEPISVTVFDWNPNNPLMLAVGYGRLDFEDEECGCVCLWSPKNPIHPERRWDFPNSVTTLSFSSHHPNLLAVGFRNGFINLLDTAENSIRLHSLFRRELPLGSGAIWKLEWISRPGSEASEQLIIMDESGSVKSFCFQGKSDCFEVANLHYTILLGNDELLHPEEDQDSMYCTKSLSGLCFSVIPEKHVCIISTKEGVIVKCDMRNPRLNNIKVPAHLGPIYAVQHSPWTSKIFLTCGADQLLKIWADGMDQPLLSLPSSQRKTMVSAQWSPIHPTIIASVSTNELAVWDLAKSCNQPVKFLRMRSIELSFSAVKFAIDGLGIVAGDRQGHVKVYQLSELPRVPFLAVEALVSALTKQLQNKPDILHKFNRFIESHEMDFKTKVI